MADFPYKPDFGYKVQPKYNTLVKRYANNVDQARLVSSQKLRTMTLPFSNRNGTEKDAAEAFYDTKKGATTTFTVEVDGETITGRFIEGTFSFVHKAGDVYDYEFQFEEVVAL